jgi:hypothetical protein
MSSRVRFSNQKTVSSCERSCRRGSFITSRKVAITCLTTRRYSDVRSFTMFPILIVSASCEMRLFVTRWSRCVSFQGHLLRCGPLLKTASLFERSRSAILLQLRNNSSELARLKRRFFGDGGSTRCMSVDLLPYVFSLPRNCHREP